MSRRVRRMAACLAVALAAVACSPPDEVGQDGQLLVASTVSPIVDLVARVADDDAEVVGLVPEGVDSHTFEPSAEDARVLSRADVVIANGLFLEEPTLELARANLAPGATIVTLGDEVIDEDEWVFDRSFPRTGGKPNPHLWLNVAYASEYVRLIAEALAEADPDAADGYRSRAAALREELAKLDASIAEAIETIPPANRKLVTYHDSWAYFGPRYGIPVVAAVQPSDFSEPSAADVRAIVEEIRREEVPAVFGSEVFPSDVLAVIAEESGARYVGDLVDDDLPGQPGEAQHSYIAMMVRNVRTIVENLGGDASDLVAVSPSQ